MTVVFLHAFPLDERMWRTEAPAPRLYGLGRTMDDWADAVLEAHPGRLILVGASMGGYAAMAAARRAPERLAGLLLVGSRPEADTPKRYAKRAETIAIARERGAEGMWDAMRENLFREDSDPEVLAQARALTLDRTEDELVTALEAMRDRPDSRRRTGRSATGRSRSSATETRSCPSRMRGASIPTRSCSPTAATWPVSSVRRSSGSSSTRR